MANVRVLDIAQGTQSAEVRLSDPQKRSLISAFHGADLDFKGYLTREDLKIATAILFGYKPSKYEVNQMLAKAGVANDAKVTMDSFASLMAPKLSASDEDEEIRQTFIAFDTQCRGFLQLDDLRRVLTRFAPNLPQHSIETAFREVDRDGDGRVSYKDFEFMMKYNLGDQL